MHGYILTAACLCFIVIHIMLPLKNSYTKASSSGFTIIELIVVIVVISILAAITFVSYLGISTSSHEKSTQADLQTTAAELGKYKANTGAYPVASVFSATINKANTTAQTTYSYSYDTAASSYCLQATAYATSFYMVNGSSEVVRGTCP